MVSQVSGVTRVTASLGFFACADVIGIADEPRLVQSLVDPWHCLEASDEPAPLPDAEQATVHVRTCNFVTSNCLEAVSGLTAKLCDKLDVHCMNPIVNDLSSDSGEFVFDVPTGGELGTGFDGYLQISAPTAPCTDSATFGAAGETLCTLAPGCASAPEGEVCNVPTFMPAFLFFNPPIRADLPAPLLAPLVPTSAIIPLTQAAGTGTNPLNGSAFITSLDCDGRPAAGVQLSTDRSDATALYSEGGVISSLAVETDESGLGGFAGISAGFAGIYGSIEHPRGEGERVSIGEVGLQVAPFTISYTTLTPRR
jgi:hypothetical protein